MLKILAKKPGHEHKIAPSYMQFCYKDLPGEPTDAAYERLIYNGLKRRQEMA